MNGVDLAGGGARGQPVERLRVLEQGGRAERVRARVIAPVVEGDERERLARRQGDVTHVGVRDDLLVARKGQQGVEVDGRVVGHPQAFFAFLLKFGFSQIIVPPWPSPTHMVVMP